MITFALAHHAVHAHLPSSGLLILGGLAAGLVLVLRRKGRGQ